MFGNILNYATQSFVNWVMCTTEMAGTYFESAIVFLVPIALVVFVVWVKSFFKKK